jgi:hypothetical protein
VSTYDLQLIHNPTNTADYFLWITL